MPDLSAWAWFGFILVCVIGCSSTRSSGSPAEEISSADVGWLCGIVSYEGTNPEYLPRVLHAVESGSNVRIHYAYEVTYGFDDETLLDFMNPFLVVGAPKSKDSVGVSGRLRITLSDADFSKIYDDSVVVDKQKFLFSEGDTLTQMRALALVQLRDALDRRLVEDRSFLSSHAMVCGSDQQ